MKSVCILVVLQILPAPCYIQLSRSSLEITFQYDFINLPNLGDVIVWPIVVHSVIFEPQIYTSNNIPKFASDKTYLILTQSQPGQIRLFYWVGSVASLVEKKKAANYALQLYSIHTEEFKHMAIVSISREAEFIESRSFEDTINCVHKIKGTHTAIFARTCVDEQLPYKVPNLYIVRGTTRTTRVKAIPMGAQWFTNDGCLILETAYSVAGLKPVTIICGPTANVKTYARAMRVGGVIDLIYIINDRRKPLKGKAMMKAFVEVLENKENCRSHEMDDSNDHLKDAETFVADRDYYHNVEVFGHPGIYLLDSASVAGLFLQLHHYSRFEENLMGLEMAEGYLHTNFSLASKPIRMRITEIRVFGTMPVNLTLNLSNFPTFRELEHEGNEDNGYNE